MRPNYTNFGYAVFVRNITFTAEEDLIERARLVALRQGGSDDAQGFDSLMQRLTHVSTGRLFTRDEMNER